jgi:hypothetical protein
MAYRIRSGYAVTKRCPNAAWSLVISQDERGIPGGEFIHRPIRVQPTEHPLNWQTRSWGLLFLHTFSSHGNRQN